MSGQLRLALEPQNPEVTPICSAEIPVTIGGHDGHVLCMRATRDVCEWEQQYGRRPSGCWLARETADERTTNLPQETRHHRSVATQPERAEATE